MIYLRRAISPNPPRARDAIIAVWCEIAPVQAAGPACSTGCPSTARRARRRAAHRNPPGDMQIGVTVPIGVPVERIVHVPVPDIAPGRQEGSTSSLDTAPLLTGAVRSTPALPEGLPASSLAAPAIPEYEAVATTSTPGVTGSVMITLNGTFDRQPGRSGHRVLHSERSAATCVAPARTPQAGPLSAAIGIPIPAGGSVTRLSICTTDTTPFYRQGQVHWTHAHGRGQFAHGVSASWTLN